jgi:hypothetical protein
LNEGFDLKSLRPVWEKEFREGFAPLREERKDLSVNQVANHKGLIPILYEAAQNAAS